MKERTIDYKANAKEGGKNASKKIYGLLYRVSSIVVICDMLFKRQGKIDRITKEMGKDSEHIKKMSKEICNFPIVMKADKEKIYALLMMIGDQIDRLKITILSGSGNDPS